MTAKDGKYSCGHQNFLIGQVRWRRSIRDKNQPDHVFPHPLGLRFCFGPDLAVDVEAGVTPGKQTFRPFRAQKLLADKVGQDLAGEDLSQPRVVYSKA